MRTKFTLRCETCKMENYISKKNKRNTLDRLEANKYCPKCRKSTAHKEKNKLFSVSFFYVLITIHLDKIFIKYLPNLYQCAL